MPTYLLHGFRWDRVSIRVHIIIHNLEDAAPEWIVAPATSVTLLNSFYTLFDFLPPSNPPPASYSLASSADKVIVRDEAENGTRTLKDAKKGSVRSLRDLVRRPIGGGKEKEKGKEVNGESGKEKKRPTPISTPSTSTKATTAKCTGKKPTFNDWSAVKLIEQHDPDDLAAVSQPYAYVSDYMIEVSLGVSITEEIDRYEARMKEEEESLSVPGTPGLQGENSNGEKGGLSTPPLSAREIRRRSRRLGWFEKLRDGLQKGNEIGWFVVVCGDEERRAPSFVGTEGESEGSEEVEKPPRSAGLMMRSFFGKKKSVQEE